MHIQLVYAEHQLRTTALGAQHVLNNISEYGNIKMYNLEGKNKTSQHRCF